MLSAQYAWLAHEGAPKMVVEMLNLLGTLETPGTADNPTILAWAKETGVTGYTHDSIPWCGLVMAVVAKRAGKEIPKDPLWALNWRKFGRAVEHPMLGDVMVKSRHGGGHVTLYVGEDGSHYHCMGGNQSDSVNITRIAKNLDWSYQRPLYKVQPSNVRIVHLAPGGTPTGGSEA